MKYLIPTSFLFVWNLKLKFFQYSSLKLSSKKYCSCNTNKTCVVLVLRVVLRLNNTSRMHSGSSLKSLKSPTIYLFEICRCNYLYLLYLYLLRSYTYLDLLDLKDFLDLYRLFIKPRIQERGTEYEECRECGKCLLWFRGIS